MQNAVPPEFKIAVRILSLACLLSIAGTANADEFSSKMANDAHRIYEYVSEWSSDTYRSTASHLSNFISASHSSGQSIDHSSNQSITVGFSPGNGAENLILTAIKNAKTSIDIQAYSFTSKPIARAIANADRRGVIVRVIVDKSQLTEPHTAAHFLANQGIAVRVDSEHAIAHNKILVIDRQHVETGSFNYTEAATHRNAENAIIIWNNRPLADEYERNWQQHWQHSIPYQ